jgi:hypothetical protein
MTLAPEYIPDWEHERAQRETQEDVQRETKAQRKARLHKEALERKLHERTQVRRTPRVVESVPEPSPDLSARYHPSVIYHDLRSGLRLLHIFSRTHGHFYIALDSVTADGDIVALAEDAFFRVADRSWSIARNNYNGRFRASVSEPHKAGRRTSTRLLHRLVNDCYVKDCSNRVSKAPLTPEEKAEREAERVRKIAASRKGRKHSQATKNAIRKSLTIDAAKSAQETAKSLRAAQLAASKAAEQARWKGIVESLMRDEGLTALAAWRKVEEMERPKQSKVQSQESMWNAALKTKLVVPV